MQIPDRYLTFSTYQLGTITLIISFMITTIGPLTTTTTFPVFVRNLPNQRRVTTTSPGSNGNGKRRSQRKDDLNPYLAMLLNKAYNPNLVRHEASQGNGAEITESNKDKPQTKSQERRIVFEPYTHPTPRRTTVHTKEKGDRKEASFTIEYSEDLIPKVTEIPRDQIELPRIEEEKIKKAKSIAREITSERLALNPNGTRIKLNEFKKLYEDKVESDNKDDAELLSLTAYFCLKRHGGFLPKLPDGLINEKEPTFPLVVRVLGRHFFVNLNKANTAEQIEEFGDFRNRLPEAGLTTLYNFLSPAGLLKICYPGYLDGPDPPIREWLLPNGNKWQLDERLLERACKNIFFNEGVVNEDGTIDKEKVLGKEWSQIFNDPRNGVRGALAEGQYVKGALGALRLAAPALIGIREGQIQQWRFPNLVKITSPQEGHELIDEITRFIVEEKLKLLDGHGNVSAKKVREVRDWCKQYNDESRDCLSRCGVENAEEALKRVYPHLFGWEEGQIQPGEIKVGNKWYGKEGERLFSLRFAKSLHTVFERLKEQGVDGFENHGVSFNPEATPPICLSRDSFKKLRNFYIANNVNWWDHYLSFNLVSGFLSVAGNQEKAFELLLGKVNNETGCFGNSEITVEDVKERIPRRTSIVIDLLKPLETANEEERIKINDTLSYQDGDEHYTGIQGSCLEPLLAEGQSEASGKTLTLYDAYLAAITPIQAKRNNGDELDKHTALETVLIARHPGSRGKGELILTDDRLKLLLRILRDDIIDHVSVNEATKNRLKDLIERLLKVFKPHDSPRNILISATDTEKSYGLKNCPLSILNSVLELVFEAIAINELRHMRVHGKNTINYERVLSQIREEEDVIEQAT